MICDSKSATYSKTMAASSSNSNVQEFSIRVPKNQSRKYHVMRFNGNLGVEFDKWTQVKMERENNFREYRGNDEEQPKFGAGSEFGREAKEESRRKKLGIMARKYRPDDQPWILKSCGSTVKKFKGIREGGVSENTAYYVFTHAEDGAIEAFPLHEWYKFQPIQRYKALSAEEAEMEFNKRNKHLNYFSLMLRKRLKGDEAEGELEEEGEKTKKSSKKDKELKISEMDEWMDTDDESSENEDNEDNEDKEKKKPKKVDPKKKKKRDTDLEAVEDSDDGDEEGREVDYISDSSESEPEMANLEGVAEEKGLKKLLNSDEEESEDSEKEENEKSNDEENKEEETEKNEEDEKDKKKKKKKVKKDANAGKQKAKKENDPDDDFSSDSTTDEDSTKKKKTEKKGKKEEKEQPNSENSSRSVTPTVVDSKRKLITDTLAGPSTKKPKLDLPNYIPGSLESGITEDAVRKYLMRKPMTTTELLQKFKSKKTGVSSEQLVNIMTQILKKINPVKQMLKGKMYLSLKTS